MWIQDNDVHLSVDKISTQSSLVDKPAASQALSRLGGLT